MKNYNIFKNKRILITGGTGSFGSMFLKNISLKNYKEILVISRDEDKQHTLRYNYRNKKNIKFIIGNVSDKNSISNWFKNIDIVIHAAALKQVPSCEYHPIEAYKTNVIGTQNVVDCCIENNVKKFVFLSTDKAVYPVNAMGITKALAEKVVVSKARNLGNKSKTCLNIIRYGNVIASRGSVIRTFVNQIKNKEPITITSNEMTRFFMSLEKAISLLTFAIDNGKQGEILIQKADSINLLDLGTALKKIFKCNNVIKNIGIRHGEKKYEILLSQEEANFCYAPNKNILVIRPDNRNLNYEIYFSKGQKKNNIYPNGYRSDNIKILSVKQIINILKKEDFIISNL